MNIKLKPVVLAICLIGMVIPPVFSFAASSTEDDTNQRLEMHLAMLQKKVDSLEHQLAINTKTNTQHSTNVNEINSPAETKHPNRVAKVSPTRQSTHRVKSEQPRYHRMSGRELVSMIRSDTNYLPFDLDVPGQAFVSTGPYVGVPISYSGSDLIINSPSVNTDLQLLNIRKSIHDQLLTMLGGLPVKQSHSHLLLSGVVETQAGYAQLGGRPDTSDIDVTNVSFDAFFMGPSDWTLGFIEFSYDNGLNNTGLNTGNSFNTSYYRFGNSRVFVNKAFVTIGDLSKSPIYGTFGQFYVPFGRYSSIMISDPLSKILGRTKARAIQLGFQQQGDNAFYGAAYIFRGDSHASSVSRINNGGLNLGYKFKLPCFGGDVGAGVIGNIADSAGMQLGNGFQYYERLHHRVPAYNLRGIFSIVDKIDIISEFIGATTDFNPNDMSYKNSGAKPWAFDIEAGYSFMILGDKPSTLGVGYSQSHDALTLGIPMSRYSVVFNTSLFRSTLQALEIRHDKNYAESVEANGPTGSQTTPGQCTAAVCHASGKSDNVITASFDYYF